jgi:NADH-quinone oxidoreductase subunit J
MMLNIIENILVSLCMVTCLSVIFVNNPIQSLLYLIISFALSSMLFMILGAEFVSLLVFLVYVGAIAVLFLFIIMMLNLKIVELRNYYLRYLPVGSFIIFFIFFEFSFLIYNEFFFVYSGFVFFDWFVYLFNNDNIFLISSLIYTYYGIYFFCLALVLLISMLGSIILVINWGSSKNKTLYYNVYFYKNKHDITLSR